jgi:hypothetical protein
MPAVLVAGTEVDIAAGVVDAMNHHLMLRRIDLEQNRRPASEANGT